MPSKLATRDLQRIVYSHNHCVLPSISARFPIETQVYSRHQAITIFLNNPSKNPRRYRRGFLSHLLNFFIADYDSQRC